MPSQSFKKIVSTTLAGVIFFTQGLCAHMPEKNFWDERRRARLQTPAASTAKSGGAPLAFDLPAAALEQTLITQGLASQNSAAASPLLRNTPLHKKLSDLTAQLSQAGIVRSIRLPHDRLPAPGAPVVVHIQDVHGHAEAQKNIAQMLTQLIDGPAPVRVGLEGAWGPIDTAWFRRAAPEIRAEAGSFLLNTDLIAGPEFAAFSSRKEPAFVGVEEAELYQAHVAAVKACLPLQAAALRQAEKQIQDIDARKKSIFSPELQTLDRQMRERLAGRLSLGDYLRALAAAAGSEKPGRQVTRFLDAEALEKSLDNKRAAQERNVLVSRLLRQLPPSDTQALVQTALAFRAGRLPAGGFYDALTAAARRAGIDAAAFPEFEKYVRYAVLADGISGEKLLAEIKALEDAAGARLCRTPAEKNLYAASRRAALTEKLVQLTLTPEEWAEYKSEKGGVRSEKGQREESLHPSPLTSHFETFYELAEARNRALADNLLKNAPPLTVLVAGGFHSSGVAAWIERRGAVLVTVAPRLTDVAADGDYLRIFAQEKTPLEKLFESPHITLVDSPKIFAERGRLEKFFSGLTACLEAVRGATAPRELEMSPDGQAAIFARDGLAFVSQSAATAVDRPFRSRFAGRAPALDGVTSGGLRIQVYRAAEAARRFFSAGTVREDVALTLSGTGAVLAQAPVAGALFLLVFIALHGKNIVRHWRRTLPGESLRRRMAVYVGTLIFGAAVLQILLMLPAVGFHYWSPQMPLWADALYAGVAARWWRDVSRWHKAYNAWARRSSLAELEVDPKVWENAEIGDANATSLDVMPQLRSFEQMFSPKQGLFVSSEGFPLTYEAVLRELKENRQAVLCLTPPPETPATLGGITNSILGEGGLAVVLVDLSRHRHLWSNPLNGDDPIPVGDQSVQRAYQGLVRFVQQWKKALASAPAAGAPGLEQWRRQFLHDTTYERYAAALRYFRMWDVEGVETVERFFLNHPIYRHLLTARQIDALMDTWDGDATRVLPPLSAEMRQWAFRFKGLFFVSSDGPPGEDTAFAFADGPINGHAEWPSLHVRADNHAAPETGDVVVEITCPSSDLRQTFAQLAGARVALVESTRKGIPEVYSTELREDAHGFHAVFKGVQHPEDFAGTLLFPNLAKLALGEMVQQANKTPGFSSEPELDERVFKAEIAEAHSASSLHLPAFLRFLDRHKLPNPFVTSEGHPIPLDRLEAYLGLSEIVFVLVLEDGAPQSTTHVAGALALGTAKVIVADMRVNADYWGKPGESLGKAPYRQYHADFLEFTDALLDKETKTFRFAHWITSLKTAAPDLQKAAGLPAPHELMLAFDYFKQIGDEAACNDIMSFMVWHYRYRHHIAKVVQQIYDISPMEWWERSFGMNTGVPVELPPAGKQLGSLMGGVVGSTIGAGRRHLAQKTAGPYTFQTATTNVDGQGRGQLSFTISLPQDSPRHAADGLAGLGVVALSGGRPLRARLQSEDGGRRFTAVFRAVPNVEKAPVEFLFPEIVKGMVEKAVWQLTEQEDTASLAVIPGLKKWFKDFGDTKKYKLFFGPVLEEVLFRGLPVSLVMAGKAFFLTSPVDYILWSFFTVSVTAILAVHFYSLHAEGQRGGAAWALGLILPTLLLPIADPFLDTQLPPLAWLTSNAWLITAPIVLHIVVNIVRHWRGLSLASARKTDETKKFKDFSSGDFIDFEMKEFMRQDLNRHEGFFVAGFDDHVFVVDADHDDRILHLRKNNFALGKVSKSKRQAAEPDRFQNLRRLLRLMLHRLSETAGLNVLLEEEVVQDLLEFYQQQGVLEGLEYIPEDRVLGPYMVNETWLPEGFVDPAPQIREISDPVEAIFAAEAAIERGQWLAKRLFELSRNPEAFRRQWEALPQRIDDLTPADLKKAGFHDLENNSALTSIQANLKEHAAKILKVLPKDGQALTRIVSIQDRAQDDYKAINKLIGGLQLNNQQERTLFNIFAQMKGYQNIAELRAFRNEDAPGGLEWPALPSYGDILREFREKFLDENSENILARGLGFPNAEALRQYENIFSQWSPFYAPRFPGEPQLLPIGASVSDEEKISPARQSEYFIDVMAGHYVVFHPKSASFIQKSATGNNEALHFVPGIRRSPAKESSPDLAALKRVFHLAAKRIPESLGQNVLPVAKLEKELLKFYSKKGLLRENPKSAADIIPAPFSVNAGWLPGENSAKDWQPVIDIREALFSAEHLYVDGELIAQIDTKISGKKSPKGDEDSVSELAGSLAIIPGLQKLFRGFGDGKIYKLFVGPIVEEVLFRGLPVTMAVAGKALFLASPVGSIFWTGLTAGVTIFLAFHFYFLHEKGQRGGAAWALGFIVPALLLPIADPFLGNHLPWLYWMTTNKWLIFSPVVIHIAVNGVRHWLGKSLAIVDTDADQTKKFEALSPGDIFTLEMRQVLEGVPAYRGLHEAFFIDRVPGHVFVFNEDAGGRIFNIQPHNDSFHYAPLETETMGPRSVGPDHFQTLQRLLRVFHKRCLNDLDMDMYVLLPEEIPEKLLDYYRSQDVIALTGPYTVDRGWLPRIKGVKAMPQPRRYDSVIETIFAAEMAMAKGEWLAKNAKEVIVDNKDEAHRQVALNVLIDALAPDNLSEAGFVDPNNGAAHSLAAIKEDLKRRGAEVMQATARIQPSDSSDPAGGWAVDVVRLRAENDHKDIRNLVEKYKVWKNNETAFHNAWARLKGYQTYAELVAFSRGIIPERLPWPALSSYQDVIRELLSKTNKKDMPEVVALALGFPSAEDMWNAQDILSQWAPFYTPRFPTAQQEIPTRLDMWMPQEEILDADHKSLGGIL